MIVITDFNGTLSHGAPILGLADWVGNHQSKFRKTLFQAKILPQYLLAKNGLIDWNRWVMGMFIDSVSLLHDATPELFEEVVVHMMETELWPKRRTDMMARIEAHVQAGDKVYIATGMWQPAVDHFAARMGAVGLGTAIDFVDGRMKLTEPIGHGEAKAAKIKSRLGVERVDVAYGDTSADIPLLEMADKPVAVYPDAVLKETALARGWEIFGDRADDK